ncbi:fibronectin type III domain-containing protein, partial [Shewanella sp. NKUCC01_JLK]|uniref:fibronectin type III domain-containing protein n=1 Tax=Shewanella sp. NKUCC01_JLK TaxID=2842123 RepID=UPI001C5B9B13
MSGAIRYAIYEKKNNEDWVLLSNDLTSTQYTRNGLSDGTYYYKVKALNEAGWGSEKTSTTVSVLLPPPVPASINVPSATVTNGSIAISWAAASTATSYTLQESVSDGAWTTITSATTPSYTVTGRQNGSYKYQVQACNASGC